MRPDLTFQVAPVELLQTLKRDAATSFGAKPSGDFLPRLAVPTLLADELNERFKAAAISASATTPIFFGFRIHSPSV